MVRTQNTALTSEIKTYTNHHEQKKMNRVNNYRPLGLFTSCKHFYNIKIIDGTTRRTNQRTFRISYND